MSYGAGHDLLVIAARRMRDAVRRGDLVPRPGDDELAILLSGLPNTGRAAMLCQRVVSSIAEPMQIKGRSTRVGASAEVVRLSEHDATQEDLFRRIDLVLYTAKHPGRGVWEWYYAGL